MQPIRVKTVQESDLRMLGDLARNIQRVLPVTQADIDAAALGKGWVVWKVFEVSEPLDNMRGGTQLIIRQNSITPGQNVRRVLIVSGPGGQTVVIRGSDYIVLPDAIADSLSYVKAFGGTEQGLPDGYTQLEYLGSNSQAYIDTGIAGGKDTLTIKCKFMYNAFVSYGGIYGNYVSDAHNGIRCILASDEDKIITNNNTICNTAGNTGLGCAVSQIHTLISKHDTVTLDGVTTAISNTATGTKNANNIALFNRSITNPNTSRDIGLRVYGFKIYDADVLVSNLIPCRRKSDSVLGMYDTVSGQFFTNAGTETFEAGPAAVPTPGTPMNIVSNNGAINYTDSELPIGYNRLLGVTMNDNCYYQVTGFKLTGADTVRFSFSAGGQCNVLGCYTTSSAQDNYSLYAITVGVGRYLRYNGGTYRSDVTPNTRYAVEITPTGSTGFPVASSWEQKEFETSQDFCIGTSNTTLTSAKFIGSFYGAIEVVGRAKFIPCERFSDGEIGYYDTYTGTFYEPVGTRPVSLGYDNSYKSITVSGPIETIWAHSKNLLDMTATNIVLGKYINNSGGIIDAGSNFYNSKYIPVVAGETYTWSTSSSLNYFSVMEYDSAYVFKKRTLFGTSSSSPAGTSGSITLRADTAFVLIGSNIDSADVTLNKIAAVDWQFEKGSTATAYQPYYDGGTATAEMLLKVGDYQDEQEILSGAITRNVGVKVLDGTENWSYSSSRFRLNIQDYLVGSSIMATIISHYKLPAINVGSIANGEARFGKSTPDSTVSDGNMFIIHDDNYTSLNSYKTWLTAQYNAGTPVIVIYPLKTPTTESVAGQTLQVTGGDNTLEITQASLNGLELEAEYQAAVSLTIQEVQDANLDPNVQVTIN